MSRLLLLSDSTVLLCTVLYCTVVYCAVLYSTVLYCTVVYCAVLLCIVLYCSELLCTVMYCTALTFLKSYNGLEYYNPLLIINCTVLYLQVTVLYCNHTA